MNTFISNRFSVTNREIAERQSELLRLAEGYFSAPANGFTLTYEVSSRLIKLASGSAAHGLEGLPPVRQFEESQRGKCVVYGLLDYTLELGGTRYRLLQYCNRLNENQETAFDDFWMIAADQYDPFYADLRQFLNERTSVRAPLMPTADRERLWKNTIGFLQRGEDALERFGVPLKRGVLLMGTPGNGKTSACRWLESEAEQFGYDWKTVTVDMYQNACSRGFTAALFDLEKPGVVFFDDLDHAFRNRDEHGSSLEQSRFLAELDGLHLRQGVVYLFTTNAGIEDLDPAFRRPGRIDHMIRFNAPTPELRREFLTGYWPTEIAQAIPIDRAVAATDGLSFAELDEIKKQLVLNYLDSHRWDWEEAFGMFRIRMEEERPRRPLGFAPPTAATRE
jgi:cell division protease FtsH